MAVGLRARSMLFTLFGDYVHPLGAKEIWVGSLVRLGTGLGMSPGALRSAISRMRRQGWLISRGLNGRPFYALSEAGQALIEEGARRIYRDEGHQWDGQWLLVTQGEGRSRAERDRLRSGLAFLGFGSLGKGVFISPRDLTAEVKELARRNQATPILTVLHGPLVLPQDPAAIVAEAWDLASLRRRYVDYLKRSGPRLAKDRQLLEQGRLSDQTAFRTRLLLTHEYRRFPFADPDLPQALLPPDWPGTQARALFLEYNRLLRPGAERHFRAVADVAVSRRPTDLLT